MSRVPWAPRPTLANLRMSARWLLRSFIRCSHRQSDDVIAWFLSRTIKDEFRRAPPLSTSSYRRTKRNLKRGWEALRIAEKGSKGQSRPLKKLIAWAYGVEGPLAVQMRLWERRVMWQPERLDEHSLSCFHPLIRQGVLSKRSLDKQTEYHVAIMQRIPESMRLLYWSSLQGIEDTSQLIPLPALAVPPSSSPRVRQLLEAYCARFSGYPLQTGALPDNPPVDPNEQLKPGPAFVYPKPPLIEE